MQKTTRMFMTALMLSCAAAYQQVRAQSGSTAAGAPGLERQPLACDIAAMTALQRSRHRALAVSLRKAVEQVKELPNGYSFRYAHNPERFLQAAEFAALESRCCPFYRFTLEQEPNGGAFSLSVTGPNGTKPFIKGALAP